MPRSRLQNPDLIRTLATLLIACLALSTHSAFARQLPDVAPMGFSVTAWTDPGTNIWGAHVGGYRTVPLPSLLPQTAPGSSIRILMLEAGVQVDHTDVNGRFRVGGLDLDVQRGRKSVLLTIADYDRAGTMDLNARWLRLGFGPGLSHNGPRTKGRIAVHVISGLTTRKLGKSLYASIPNNSTSDTMIEGGLVGRSSLYHAYGWSLDVRAEYMLHNVAGDMRTFMAESELTWNRNKGLRTSLFAHWYGAERNSIQQSEVLLGLRLRFLP